jgi:hypothetical protein
MRYTRESLEQAVRSSTSVMGVIAVLGRRMTGGTHSHVKRLIGKYGLDTSHFHGKGSNRGASHTGGLEKLQPEDVLVYNRRKGLREKAHYLRAALLAIGVKEYCVECGLKPEWNGRPLRLPIDHKNGDPVDCRRENLRFMCPNCHSQTDTFGTKRRLS